VFIVIGYHEDVAKQEILSASEHFGQIHTSRLGTQAASPCVYYAFSTLEVLEFLTITAHIKNYLLTHILTSIAQNHSALIA